LQLKLKPQFLLLKQHVLHIFLRAKQCDNQHRELQPPDQPSQQSVFTHVETDPKQATNVACSVRENSFIF
jgi:hypothetical protein